MNDSLLKPTILALGIAIGLIGLGMFTSQAIIEAKKTERFVTIKGISERNVKANLGIWEIDYREAGNDLIALSDKMITNQQTIITFLTTNGFKQEQIEIRPTRVTDLVTNSSADTTANKLRYVVTSGVRIRSTNVDQVQAVSSKTTELIKKGINLSFSTSDYASDLNPNPSYFYTQLDEIRPQMLVEATQSAYAVAKQFAKDSQNKLGRLRRANQGVFEITPRDASDSQAQASSIDKKVRLVTTIDYLLKD